MFNVSTVWSQEEFEAFTKIVQEAIKRQIMIADYKLLYFTADWCQPCKVFGPVMDSITSIEVNKVNVDKAPELADNHSVMSVPTVILFGKDNLEISRIMGARTKEMVLEWLDEEIRG